MGLTAHRPASRSAPTYRAAWKCPACQLGLRHRLAGTASARASASASTQAHSHRLGCRAAEASRTSRHLARPACLASQAQPPAPAPAPGHRPLQHFHASVVALQRPRHKAHRFASSSTHWGRYAAGAPRPPPLPPFGGFIIPITPGSSAWH